MSERHLAGRAATILEAAPVPSVLGAAGVYAPRTHWGALAFTLLTAGTLVWGASQVPQLAAALIRTPSAPVATAAPRPTVAPTLPPADSLASAWVGQSAYPVIGVDGRATVSVTFRNTGTATWQRGTPSEVRLATVGDWDPSMSVNWPAADRAAIQSEPVVRPGEIVTFRFEIRGTRIGTFRLGLRPVVADVGPLNDEGVYTVVVVK